MNDLRKIKEYIYENEKIEEILEKLECTFIGERGNRVEAQLPDGFSSNNRRSVQVKKRQSLPCNIRSRGWTGDIFGLVSYIKHGFTHEEDIQKDLSRAKNWLVEVLGCHHLIGQSKKQTVDCLGWLKGIKKKRTRMIDLSEIEPNDVIEESLLSEYVMCPVQWWRDEGMSLSTQREFEVGFDIQSQRIVFPIRNKNGELIGVKGRTVVGDDRKYLYLHRCNKSIELFNLYRALPFIKEKKRVFVFESEKSTMFASQYGFPESVAICGDALDDVQVQLLKNLGHDIQIILCYDKDEETKFIYDEAKKITRRDVYGVFDVEGLLDDKDAPVDKGAEVFEKLVKENCYFICGKEIQE